MTTQVFEGHHDWENVAANPERGDVTDRMKVPGGWIYRTLVFVETGDGVTAASVGVSLAMVFVPWSDDRELRWAP